MDAEGRLVALLIQRALQRRHPVSDQMRERRTVKRAMSMALAKQLDQQIRAMREDVEWQRLLAEAIQNLPPGWRAADAGECHVCGEPVSSEHPGLVCPRRHSVHQQCLALGLTELGRLMEPEKIVGLCPICEAEQPPQRL